VPRHGRHDPPILFGITVAVVDVGHRAGLVIGDPVHRIAAETEPGDARQTGSPEIVRCGAFDPVLGDELEQQAARLMPRVQPAFEQRLRRL